MKKCSYCGRDNDDAATNCSECGSAFLSPQPSTVDPELEDPALNLVVVGTFPSLEQAAMAETRLEAAGIEACIPEEYGPQMLGGAVSLLEPLTVRVAARDYETARQVLTSEG